MSYLAEIDMTVADFREHYAPIEAAVKEPHWLLGSVYGRDLLKIKLRISRPEVVVLAVKPQVLRDVCASLTAIAHGKPRRFGGAFQGFFADFRGMGVARHLAFDGAQAKAFGGVIAGCLDAAIVQNDGLRAFAFKVKFAILGPGQGCAQHRKRCLFVKLRLEGSERGVSHRGLSRAEH